MAPDGDFMTVREFVTAHERGEHFQMSRADARGLTALFRVAREMFGSDDTEAVRLAVREMAKASGVHVREVMAWPLVRMENIAAAVSNAGG